MKTINERIFAKDTDMMFWQQDNCTQCAKAVWYNARLGRCPKHNCALQRDMEAQAGGEMEINERSFRVLHGVKRCPLFKPKDTTPDDSPVYDAHDFAKGETNCDSGRSTETKGRTETTTLAQNLFAHPGGNQGSGRTYVENHLG